ncbi:Syntaxin-16 [Bulinus truncatus]|nr:Syntaxin-16 [Bulinus truncatus]
MSMSTADILDVNEIFRELGALVHTQGEVLDTIDSNVERAYTNVESGRDQLIKAAEYQRKSRKKMCCLIVILLVVAVIVTGVDIDLVISIYSGFRLIGTPRSWDSRLIGTKLKETKPRSQQ